MSETIVLEGTLRPEQTLSYIYLPFEVPTGTVRMRVSYTYSNAIGSDPHLTNGNTIDIGIFDPHGTDFMTEGFRGWSGSARNEFFIGTDAATPGYIKGPIQPGTWSICLGLYKISPEGCTYRVYITKEMNGPESETFPSLLPLSSEPRSDKRSANGWYRGELHCHTVNSDGDSLPADLVARAEVLGLDFLAITDHNVRTGQPSLRNLDADLILIPGMEVTTYYGHWNIWGDGKWVDFRLLEDDQMRLAISTAKERGFLTSCNHPRQYGPDWVFKAVDNFDCVEIWNGPWVVFNQEALDFWEAKLRTGQRYPALGGSDAHFLKRDHIAQVGTPTTWIYCEDDPSAQRLVENMRAGHIFITASPDGPELYLKSGKAMMGDCISWSPGEKILVEVDVKGGKGSILELRDANGLLHRTSIQQDVAHMQLELDAALYVRAQLLNEESPQAEVLALTNPIYLIEG